MKIKTFFSNILIASALGILTACTSPAPQYVVSIPNVQSLKAATTTAIGVGQFSAQDSGANDESIMIRASGMVSADGTFSKYLQRALIQELTEAKLFDPKSNVQISAVLIKNNISAAGFITGSTEIEAKFSVTRNGTVVFERVKRAMIEWESSFVGGIAIPRARESYPNAVTALLKELYADKEFVAALKK